MTELSLRRNTGIFGLVATLISLTQLPLYFMYTGAPPQWDILTRVMVSIIGSAIFIVFLTGFRLVIRQASQEMEWASTIALVSGLMWLTFSSVAQSMEAGTAIVSKIPIDPTVDGVLAPGQFLMFGSSLVLVAKLRFRSNDWILTEKPSSFLAQRRLYAHVREPYRARHRGSIASNYG